LDIYEFYLFENLFFEDKFFKFFFVNYSFLGGGGFGTLPRGGLINLPPLL